MRCANKDWKPFADSPTWTIYCWRGDFVLMKLQMSSFSPLEQIPTENRRTFNTWALFVSTTKNSIRWEYFWNRIGLGSQGFFFHIVKRNWRRKTKVNNGQWFNCVSVYAIVCAWIYAILLEMFIYLLYMAWILLCQIENANAILIYSYNSFHFRCIRSGLLRVPSTLM